MATTSGVHLAAVFVAQVGCYTGVFITAHDAMHGLVAPANPVLNHGLGRLCALLFAAFDYEALHTAHWQHHARPATHKARNGIGINASHPKTDPRWDNGAHTQDPDYHDGHRTSAPAWFLTFMRRYISLAQLLRLACAAGCMHAFGCVPVPNLVLFWAMTALTSALQLFIVGTYLPHRGPHRTKDRHRARSLEVGTLCGLVSCYNFGSCHYEHHRFPRVPWWRLHVLRAALQASDSHRGR